MCCFQVQFLVNKSNTPYNGSTDNCKKTIIQDVIKTMEYIKVHTDFHTITLVLYIGSLPKLGYMIPLWKGKNPIYYGVIRSKVKVTVTINKIFDNRVVST